MLSSLTALRILIEEVLSTMPRKSRPRLKTEQGRVEVNIEVQAERSEELKEDCLIRPGSAGSVLFDHQTQGADDDGLQCIERILLDCRPSLKEGATVVQSSTDAHEGRHGLNPRRFRTASDTEFEWE